MCLYLCLCVCHVPVHGFQKKHSSAWIRVSLGKKEQREHENSATIRLCTLRSRQARNPSSAQRRWEMTPKLFQRNARLKHTTRLHFLSLQPSVSTCMDLGRNNNRFQCTRKKAFTTALISWPFPCYEYLGDRKWQCPDVLPVLKHSLHGFLQSMLKPALVSGVFKLWGCNWHFSWQNWCHGKISADFSRVYLSSEACKLLPNRSLSLGWSTRFDSSKRKHVWFSWF